MRLQVPLFLTFFSLVRSQVNVVETAKELSSMAKNHNHNHNEDHLVDLLVHVKNQEGKHFASKLADRVRVERKGWKYMGITAKYSQIKELEKNKNIVAVDIDHEEFAIEAEPSLRRRLSEDIPWGIEEVLQDLDFWNNLDADKSPVSVCVVDTGYDLGHEDLPVEPNVDGTDGAGEEWSYDGNSHGTHCAGTVAALGSNDKGVVGVLPNNEDGNFMLLIGKAFDASGRGSNSQTMAAVQGCVDQGANIISLSLGGSGQSRSTMRFYDELYNDENILLIAAAGNDGNDRYSYPASYSSLVSVASLQSTHRTGISRSSFSQYNDQVEIAAPGSSVLSTIPGNGYGYKSGTSMATPHVSGVAGLLWMYFPQCTNAQIRHVMLATASTLTSEDDGCDVYTGYGMVQAKSAYELLAEGDCGGDLGPSASSPVGGCGELDDDGSDDSNDDTAAPTPAPSVDTAAPTDAPSVDTAAPTDVPSVATAAPIPSPTKSPNQCGEFLDPCRRRRECCSYACYFGICF